MIQVRQLKFSYKNRPLFQDLSFDIDEGTLTRITGPNGAGKSTLLGLMTGIVPGGSPYISFSSEDDFRQWTSWIAPDANGLFPTLSAVENIEFWLKLRQIDINPEDLSMALTDWGLTGAWVQNALPVSKFSTGMRRRLSLVRLILEQSKLWLLDEPLFGLDDSACRLFRDRLSKHIQSGGTAIVVTHDDRLLESLAHKTIKLEGVSK